MKFFKIASLLIALLLISAGCSLADEIKSEATKEVKQQSKKAIDEIKNGISGDKTPAIENSKEDKDLINSSTNDENYAYINDNKADLTSDNRSEIKKKGNSDFWVNYSDLDKYGRGGKVTALVTSESVNSHSSKSQERPSFDYNVHVAGEYKDGQYDPIKQTWKGENSNNKILQLDGYRGYIYNKSHSLAWSLGGDMETHNLTLGTRAQNVGSNKASEGGGMGYPETQVREAIYSKPETKVFYEVVPVYNNDELVPRGSHVKAYSINDNGKTVNFNVWIANKQKGVNINYKDGTYKQ
ncbi:TPA: DNA/RNA non-specific endonuclease [Staphylococcus aureus]|nr:DNA/RNA non-specific endonuclease [Staphylococcus aureus]HEA0030402.1 DNA/RNA non-specific endonuclease [Staphylococcus aureus]HEA0065399.1 DNA/RNA non-specific endonuclease [Staphylococcus aureus]HEA0070782.1 DNA/RNA non-specific endonuclease [Staphylococcus aureus]HEA0078730.1 DNA/RNA non-specific endonuclease [Staphylococcus aureus]